MAGTVSISLTEPIYYYKAGEFTAGPGWVHKTMRHDRDFQIILGVRGKISISIDGEPVDILPGECVLLRPGATIGGGGPARGPIDFYWVHFFAAWRESIIFQKSSIILRPNVTVDFDKIRHREFITELNNVSMLPDKFRLNQQARAFLLFGQLLDVSNSYRYSQRESDFMTGALLVELSHQYLSGLAEKKRDESALTARICEWIRSHMSADLTVGSVAGHFAMNADYLSRLFRRELGTNLRSYLLDMRLETAKVLLMQTDIPIARVARNSFFNDERNFMKLFKRRTGVTPTQYREGFSHTHLNNPLIDPSIPVPQEVEAMFETRSRRQSVS